MPRIKRITSNTGKILIILIILPNTATEISVIYRDSRRAFNDSEEREIVEVILRLEPAEVLDGETAVGMEGEDGGLEAEVEEGDAAEGVGGGEEERGGVWGPLDGGDVEGRGGGVRGEGERGEELHGGDVEDGD